MKNILSYILFAFILIAAFSTNLNARQIEGDWEFSVQQAPWEYNAGIISIESNSEEELTGTVTFHTGNSIPVESITVDDASVTFSVFVDGYEVNAVCTLEGDQLVGQVQSVEGNMSFSAIRKAEEEES